MPKIDRRCTKKYDGKDGAFAVAEIRSDSGGDCRYVSVRAGRADHFVKKDVDPVLVHVCMDCGTVHVSGKGWRISTDEGIFQKNPPLKPRKRK